MKKLFFSIVICFLCFGLVACAPRVDPALSPIGFTKEQKIEDFDYLCKLMDELYPFWNEVAKQGTHKDALTAKYRPLMEASETDCDFLNLILDFFDELDASSLGHLLCVDAASYPDMVATSDDVSGRTTWTNLLKNSVTANTYALFASDIDGKFIPISQATQATADQKQEPLAKKESEFYTEIINDGKTGYIRMPTFDGAKIGDQHLLIDWFVKGINKLPNLILDIRGNTGGSNLYWMGSLVSPNITEEKKHSRYYLYDENLVSNELSKPFLDERYTGLKTYSHPISELPSFDKLSKSAADFNRFTVFDYFMPSMADDLSFTGKIWILTDNRNVAAAASFIDFCDETDFATQVGQPSDGDDSFIDPALFALPNSGLVIRFDLFYGLNPDGTSNAVSGVTPDIMCMPEDALEVCLKEINQAA